MNLLTSVAEIKGIGPKTAAQFVAAGLSTAGDLMEDFPRSYEDYTGAQRIADLVPGKVTLRARAVSVNSRHVRGKLTITTAVLEDSAGDQLNAVWFNQPYRANQLAKGDEFLFSGVFELKRGRYQLTTPTCTLASDLPVDSNKIVPVYSMRAGLKPSLIRKAVEQIKPLLEFAPEILPAEVIDDNDLCSRAQALSTIHFPSDRDQLALARHRLGFEEVFTMILAAKLNRMSNQQLKGFQIEFNQPKISQFVANLPFQLTPVQKRSIWEIIQDFMRLTPMNRLLQGDVGSGKTVVAAVAAYQAYLGGYQTALMVPTEVLAKQHMATLKKMLEPYGVKVCLLTGSTKGKEREAALKEIASGAAQVVVGTHALFQPAVKFKQLGFVVIDEQHRFGVKQRQDLLAKTDSEHLPHLLAMTATPIPRSLQLTIFGDLDVSTLDQLPQGRQVIQTKIVLPNERPQLVERVRAELAAGRQVYYVAGLIEDSDVSERVSAEALYKTVTKLYPEYRVGILHGKMAAVDKERVMEQFAVHQLDILVSTTVIEVGVDVPNATVMVIEDAENFGLSQLHQLRGRVGRGKYQSYCYLCQSDTKQPSRRLKEVERSNDGFYLAQVDLELRGAGEIYGTMQHGDINFRMANLADTKLLRAASNSAARVAQAISQDAQYLVKYSQLRQMVNKYQKITTLN